MICCLFVLISYTELDHSFRIRATAPDQGLSATPAAAADPTAEYTPYFSKDTGYTIWLNKKNPRNSYYEYPDKKKK